MSETVFVLFEGPDMTYYGDAEIHGVYARREAAEAKARELYPTWKGESYEPIRIAEMPIDP